MLLTLTTTHQPATDLGFLLMKHPDNVHPVELAFGTATLFYPEAEEARCTAALTVEVDPSRRTGPRQGRHARHSGSVCQRPALRRLV